MSDTKTTAGNEEIRQLLSEALDLCLRSRKIDAAERTSTMLNASADPEKWQASGNFDRYCDRWNAQHPDKPLTPECMALPLWALNQYEQDLKDWEARARKALS